VLRTVNQILLLKILGVEHILVFKPVLLHRHTFERFAVMDKVLNTLGAGARRRFRIHERTVWILPPFKSAEVAPILLKFDIAAFFFLTV